MNEVGKKVRAEGQHPLKSKCPKAKAGQTDRKTGLESRVSLSLLPLSHPFERKHNR
jgi:hypothetical protein